jgi:hypothetical protein
MTPKEKSQQITDYYQKLLSPHVSVSTGLVKECSIRAVDEIIETLYLNFYDSVNGTYEFWEDVRKELKDAS